MKSRVKVLDPFKDNLFRRELDEQSGEKVITKSCPKCSKKAGTTIFYRESEFGEMIASNGTTKPQKDCLKHHRR